MVADVKQQLFVQRQDALPVADNSYSTSPPRGGRYGETATVNYMAPKKMASDAGSFWIATNPTIGTAPLYATQTSFSDTVALFAIQNTDVPGGKRMYLDTYAL